jgi:hypothetical protein
MRCERADGRKTARRFPLLYDDGAPIRTLTAAKDAFDVLKNCRRESALPQPGRKPAFAAGYCAMQSTRSKKARTQNHEAQAIERWKAHLADVRVDRITTPMIRSYQEARWRGCKLGGREFAPAHPLTVAGTKTGSK